MSNFLRLIFGEREKTPSKAEIEDALRTYLEARIATEIGRMRDFNRRDLEEVQKERLRNWRTLSLVLAFLTIFVTFLMWFYTKEEMAKGISAAVDAQMVQPELDAHINSVISQQAKGDIDKSLSPFKAQVDALSAKASQIDVLNQRIATLDDTIKKANAASANLQSKLDSSDSKLSELNQTATDIKNDMDFTATAIKADNDDKDSFDVLVKYAFDPKSNYYDSANGIVLAITSRANPSSAASIDWKTWPVNDPNNPTIDSIKNLYKIGSLRRADYKEGFEQYIWDSKVYTLHDKLEYLIWILQNDKSISSITYAQFLLDNEAHLKANILGTNLYLEWWDKNKDSYKGK